VEPWKEHTADLVKPWQRHVIAVVDIVNQSVFETVIQTVLWVGWWNLLAYWAWPWPETHFVLRDVLYMVLGTSLKVIGVVWFPEDDISNDILNEWQEGIPAFGWRRKFRQFFTRYLHFLAFLFAWVGFWNVFDLYIHNCGYCWEREIWYITFPLILLFISQEVLSKDTLYWLVAQCGSGGTASLMHRRVEKH